jgi:hypothetical protein
MRRAIGAKAQSLFAILSFLEVKSLRSYTSKYRQHPGLWLKACGIVWGITSNPLFLGFELELSMQVSDNFDNINFYRLEAWECQSDGRRHELEQRRRFSSLRGLVVPDVIDCQAEIGEDLL